MCDQYTPVLTSLLDKHAPLQTKKVVEKTPTPWMTSKLLDCKRSCRQLERRWTKSRSGYDRSKYRNYRNLCNRLMTEAKSQYFLNFIDGNSKNPLRLWDTINNILHRTPAAALPESNNVKSLCEHLAKHFCDKIRTIRANFSNLVNDVPSVQKPKIRPSAFQFSHRSSKHHYFKLWIESSLIRRWYTHIHLHNRWHSYWVSKNASELYYRGICLDGSIQAKTQS